MMFGDAVRLGVGRRLFVHAPAPIDIPVIRVTELMGRTAVRDIGLLIHLIVGNIEANDARDVRT
jgi:hypothetical protein